ncbi:MAG TPA: hypothetical protein VGK77_15095 [Candidatus Binatia bacterium]|jgi:hypothetical protein
MILAAPTIPFITALEQLDPHDPLCSIYEAINEIIQEIIALTRGEMSRNRVTLQTQLSESRWAAMGCAE